MKQFMTEDFLLSTETARKLYHEHAEKMPIIDYHCHISPWDIANDVHYENISKLWLGFDHFGDHYKWRLIRANGIDENRITGDADDRERFQVFAEMLPKAIGNPMYHWTHLELKRFFGYDGVLNGKTAEEVWNLCNEKLKTMGVRDMIRMSNVRCIATTDDPVDDLAAHKLLRDDESFSVKVVPTMRPDVVCNIRKPGFGDYIRKLEKVAGFAITSVESLKKALLGRIEYFDSMGCRASDHGLDWVPFADLSGVDLDAILLRGIAGEPVSEEECTAYQYALMLFFGREFHKRGWVMQFHYGASRAINTERTKEVGRDTGFDCMGDTGKSTDITGFLNALEETGELPRTILYSLNDNDNAKLVTIINSFQGSECPGKMQHGAAWWFNDTKLGMIDQLQHLAEGGLLGNFIGMLTDSRSFLSYTRHEYFRRILCYVIGELVENGEYPDDMETLGQMVEDISYNNTKRYFGF